MTEPDRKSQSDYNRQSIYKKEESGYHELRRFIHDDDREKVVALIERLNHDRRVRVFLKRAGLA